MLSRVLPLVSVLAALSISLTLSACVSPLAPAAKPANFYDAVRSDVEEFWADYFSSHSVTYTRISKMTLFTRETPSQCGTIDSTSYCPADRGVYLESEFMETELSDFGDFGSAVVVAHEIGHHVQNLLGFNANITFHELQADCLAGGWMKDADARGLLEVSDSQEAAGSLFTKGDRVASPWFRPDAHGSPQQRVDAFRSGFQSGVGSCF